MFINFLINFFFNFIIVCRLNIFFFLKFLLNMINFNFIFSLYFGVDNIDLLWRWGLFGIFFLD